MLSKCVADALMQDRTSGLRLAASHAERGVAIAPWCHMHGLAMLNKGMADRQWQLVETLLALLDRNAGSVTFRDLRDRHTFPPHETRMLAAEYPRSLTVQIIKPPTGRPSEILTAAKP